MKIFFASLCLAQVASFVSADGLRPNAEERRLSRLLTEVKKADGEASARLIKTIKEHEPPKPKSLPQVSKPSGATKAESNKVFKALKRRQGLKQVSFNPVKEDLEWPGIYPSDSFLSKEELVINIRLDDFPGEMIVRTRTVFPIPDEAQGSATSKSIKVTNAKEDKDERGLTSIPIEEFSAVDTLYQIEVSDEVGDGICCGTFGYGWITVTNTTKDVLWSALGNYSYVAAAYIWKDSNGDFSVVGEVNPGKETTPPPPDFPPDSGDCSMCPYGSSGSPTKDFLLRTDTEDVPLMCSEMEESIAGWSSTECRDLDAGGDLEGFGEYIRALCECPGHLPACPLCDGEQVTDLEAELPSGDITCFDVDNVFMTMNRTACNDWGRDLVDDYNDFCGCPSLTGTSPNPPVSSVESCSLCPYGSSGDRDKEFELRGTDGVYETFTCAGFEDSIGLWTTEECADLEEGGSLEFFASYIRAICDCPGQGPFCALCDGGPVADPEEELPLDDETLTCWDAYLTWLAMPADECVDWGAEAVETFEDFCGCAA